MEVQLIAHAVQQATTEASIVAEELAATSTGTFQKVAGFLELSPGLHQEDILLINFVKNYWINLKNILVRMERK